MTWFASRMSRSRGDLPDALDLATLVRLVDTGQLHPELGSVSGYDWRHTDNG